MYEKMRIDEFLKLNFSPVISVVPLLVPPSLEEQIIEFDESGSQRKNPTIMDLHLQKKLKAKFSFVQRDILDGTTYLTIGKCEQEWLRKIK